MSAGYIFRLCHGIAYHSSNQERLEANWNCVSVNQTLCATCELLPAKFFLCFHYEKLGEELQFYTWAFRCDTDACVAPSLLPQPSVSAALCAEILVSVALKLALLPFFSTSYKSQG